MSQDVALPVAPIWRRQCLPDVSHIGPGTDVVELSDVLARPA